MKTFFPISLRAQRTGCIRRQRHAVSASGFTLVEAMVAMAIFMFVIGGMVAVQIFGLRVYTLAATKLSATAAGRKTLNAMRDEIRSSQQVYVGTYANGSFQQMTNGDPQIGNAVQLFTSTNSASTNFTVFYMDPSANEVVSVDNLGDQSVLATSMTNVYCFQAEDYQGNILTNYQNNPVIRVTMSFSQWEYPIGYVGGVGINAFDHYYLRTRITRRIKQ
jgi:Tfp pilus assembly protein PilW